MHSKTPFPTCRLIRSPSNLVRRKNINFDSVLGSSRKLPGSFSGSFPKKEQNPQSEYDGCPGSSWKFPGSSPNFYEQQRTKSFHKSALCGTRRKSMCHGCTGRFLGRFPTFPRSFLEAFWKLSGSFPEAKPSQRAPGPGSALALVI